MYFHFSLLSFTHCNANFIAYKYNNIINIYKTLFDKPFPYSIMY